MLKIPDLGKERGEKEKGNPRCSIHGIDVATVVVGAGVSHFRGSESGFFKKKDLELGTSWAQSRHEFIT